MHKLNLSVTNDAFNLQNIVANNFANSPLMKKKCINEVNSLREILSNKQKRKLIIDKAKWNDTNKIPIHKVKLIENNKLSLTLTKKQFIKNLNDFADENKGKLNIIPHLFINDKQMVKYLWIVTIFKAKGVFCDIGIAMRLTKTIKKIKTAVPTGIYLFVDNQYIMNKYTLNLHDLKIGKIESEVKKMKNLRNTIENYQKEMEYYKQQIQQHYNQVTNKHG